MASKPSGLKSKTQGDLPTFDVFVSYSHADTRWKDWLVGGLSFPPPIPATIWSDRDILPSEIWNKEIKNALQRARIAVVTWLQTNWGRDEGEDRPSDEDYQYAVPELFLGTVPNESLGKCDQYLLGLLGYHMITGRLPDRVSKTRLPKSISAFGDLKPIQQFEGCESCPKVLSDLITKMISKKPSERFASVEEAIERLAKFGDESLTLAKESYRRVAKVKNWKSEIFKEFYDQLFSESEKARNMFQGINMDQQYEMLTEAVLLLLVFCEFDATDLSEPTVLSRVAHKHTKLDLEVTDFDQFQSLLVKTFVRHDPDCANNPALEPEVEHAWRKSLQPGIEFMKKHLRR